MLFRSHIGAAVGIGGAYMCIYGMEGPGGYQLFGRTIQVWNSWRQTPAFAKGKPWLLNFFDQIRFFPVSHEELTEARAAFPHGGYPVRIEEAEFSYSAYEAQLAGEAGAIGAFKSKQQAAFEAERQRWKELGLDQSQADAISPALLPIGRMPPLLVMHSKQDSTIPIAGVRALCGRVLLADRACTLIEYPGLNHGFFNFRKIDPQTGVNPSDDSTAKALDFLSQLGWAR